MKKLLVATALMVLTVTLAHAQQTFTPTCSGTNDTAAFQSLISGAGGNPRTIDIPYKADLTKRCALTTITIPSNITLDNTRGSGINRLPGQTITVQGPIVNPVGKTLFFGSGASVITGAPSSSNEFVTDAEQRIRVFGTNVAANKTGGTGTLADPWTGWNTAITWAANTAYYFPSGYYSYSTSPNFALENIRLHGDGPFKTYLKFTGSGVALNIDGGAAGGGVCGVVVANLSVRGNASATTGIYVRASHHMLLDHVEVRDVTGKALETHWSVLGTAINFRVSVNEGAFGTRPTNGIYLDERGVGEQTTAWSFIDPIVEGVSGDGIVLANASTNVFTSGTSEGNRGRGVLIGAASANNTIIGMDNEVNTGDDFTDNGIRNSFINVLSAKIGSGSGMMRIGNTSVGSSIIGGRFNSIRIEAGATDALVDHAGYNLEGTGTFFNGPTDVTLRSIRNLRTGTWDVHPYDLTFYRENGVPVLASKIVHNSIRLRGGTATVTLTGDAVFSNTAYTCVANDTTAANSVKPTVVSPSQFTLTGTGNNVINYVCFGQ